MVTVDFAYSVAGEQYEWVVPNHVTEILVELAGTPGATETGDEGQIATGGVGGHLTARIPVEPGSTLLILVGRGPLTSALLGNGGAPAVIAESDGDILAVAGGGGGGNRCISSSICGDGGAGGFSATAGGAAGLPGQPSPAIPYELFSHGGGATDSAPGVSGQSEDIRVLDGVVSRSASGTPGQASSVPIVVDLGVIAPSAPAAPTSNRTGAGGWGYFSAGVGDESRIEEVGIDPPTFTLSFFHGGGGGGSGYLIEGGEIISLADNVDIGFARISHPEAALADTGPDGLWGIALAGSLAIAAGALSLASMRARRSRSTAVS